MLKVTQHYQRIIEGKRSVIAHCVNTLGAWGAGFVVPLSKRYPQTKEYYRSLLNSYKGNRSDLLGTINLVANVAEDTDYKSFDYSFTIHMPRIGCGLAGGDWNIVEQIIKDEFINKGIEAYVYDFR